jgi:hypothetical protein
MSKKTSQAQPVGLNQSGDKLKAIEGNMAKLTEAQIILRMRDGKSINEVIRRGNDEGADDIEKLLKSVQHLKTVYAKFTGARNPITFITTMRAVDDVSANIRGTGFTINHIWKGNA